MMETRFETYLEHLCSALGHADRREGLRGYCRGLMLPLARKSVEPLAAVTAPAMIPVPVRVAVAFTATGPVSVAELEVLLM